MKNVKVDLNFQIKDLNGKVLEGSEPAAKILANYLTQSVLTDEVKITKYFGWAEKLATIGVIELDEGDVIELKKFVVDHKQIFVLAKYPIIKAFSQSSVPGKGEK